MKPLLIASNHLTLRGLDRQFVTSTLTDTLLERGFLPVMAHFHSAYRTREQNIALVETYMDAMTLSGIILQGGDDIHPSHYDASPAHIYKEILFRDYFELAMVHVALKRGLPIFGICRGMQLINVALGGTLHQELGNLGSAIRHSPERQISLGDISIESTGYTFDTMTTGQFSIHTPEENSHTVSLSEKGILIAHYAKTTVEVNSYHHQGIATLAPGLDIEALSDDNIIEAFSAKDIRTIGVQWHPEIPVHAMTHWEPLDAWLRMIA